MKIAKLSDDESAAITNDAESVKETTTAESVTETNGINRTDSIKDTTMETHVSNGDETELTTKNDEKTETTTDIPITQPECDHKNKTVNLDVDVVAQDIIKGEKDSKPLLEVDAVIKTNEALPMEIVTDEKPSETKETEDIEMEATPIDAELNSKPKADAIEDDESAKIVEVASDEAEPKHVSEEVPVVPVIPSDDQTDKTEPAEKVSSEEIVEKNNAERTTDVSLKQNGDHKEEVKVDNESDKLEDTKPKAENDEKINVTVESVNSDTTQPKEVETEKIEKIENVEKPAAIENGAKENEEMDNKENIPVEIKEKENIIEIPIHIDGDIQAAPTKPSITSATNGNGVAASKDDSLETSTTATNSNKEKMSRIELIIEEKNNDNGQLTETTTHIVKEITIVKNNVCESVENVEIMPENV